MNLSRYTFILGIALCMLTTCSTASGKEELVEVFVNTIHDDLVLQDGFEKVNSYIIMYGDIENRERVKVLQIRDRYDSDRNYIDTILVNANYDEKDRDQSYENKTIISEPSAEFIPDDVDADAGFQLDNPSQQDTKVIKAHIQSFLK